ncbi:hypothetical protein NDU88_003260 [Pleurodeles waltl]|uniref:Uncharacterized protein n=1 Tax=Pleurodeles waltl TaxID=8319 RepID=A0AAV7KV17_PLEWA|nr:hypothetical protein NDU88_003260 [Pleurodeles waltl]
MPAVLVAPSLRVNSPQVRSSADGAWDVESHQAEQGRRNNWSAMRGVLVAPVLRVNSPQVRSSADGA